MPASSAIANPSLLFLNTFDSPERAWAKPVFAALRGRGYKRFVEVCAGSFVMPTVARAAGWQPAEIEASDVGLYSAICGTVIAGGDLAGLQVRVDGEL